MATKELTEGNPLKLIAFFAIPIFLGNIFQQFYHLFDALIVGRIIGIDALAALGATSPLIFLAISFIFASTQGFSVVLAQRFGARDYDNVRKSFASAIILSIILTIILTAIFAPLTRFMLEILRTPNDILSIATDYLFIMIVGIAATIFYNVISNTIRALGDSKTPLYFLTFSVFANIFLDILFIAVFKWGVMGAAWATIVAQAISTLFCFIYMIIKFPMLHLKKEDWIVNRDFLYEHLRIGIPMGFQMSILTLGIIAVQFVLNTFGTNAIAAFTTAVRIEQIFTQTFLALGVTMATYTAQNFGAGKLSRIKEGTKMSLALVLIISVLSFIAIRFYGQNMICWFMDVPNKEVIDYALQYLDIVILFFFFLGALIVYRNILQGMGSVMAPLISGIAELIARIVGAFILAYYFSYIGLCCATPLAWLFGAFILIVGYRISIVKHFKNLKKRV